MLVEPSFAHGLLVRNDVFRKNNNQSGMVQMKFLAAVVVSFALVACGGGGSDLSSELAVTPILTLKGTAATGTALSDASVSVSCAAGAGTATTNSNGSYTVNVANGQGPCVVTVSKAATATSPAITLKSVTSGTSTTQDVNVTPLTNALVVYLEKLTGVGDTTALLTNPAAKALLSDKAALDK